MKAMREKRFAVLLAARDSDYVKKAHGGYFGVFVAAFGDGGLERWDKFRVVDGEFPAFDELDAYDGFVLSGSPHDAYGNEEWILQLCLLLQTLSAMKKRVLGICFGHQLLCRALGGRVGKAFGGWEIGVKEVNFVENLSEFKYFGDLDVVPHSAPLIEIHRDEVWEVPLGAEVMAYSENTDVEMFAVGEHILGIQGHPEYTKDILLNLIDRLVNTNTIDRGFGDEAKKRVDAAGPDRKFWLKICKGFLKGSR